MRLPSIQIGLRRNRSEIVNTRGLNLSDNTRPGDLVSCTNMASSRWPYLTTRNARSKQQEYINASSITSWEKLVAVQGTDLLFDGVRVGTVTEGEKQFAVVNTKLVIWPDKVYLDIVEKVVRPLSESVEAT